MRKDEAKRASLLDNSSLEENEEGSFLEEESEGSLLDNSNEGSLLEEDDSEGSLLLEDSLLCCNAASRLFRSLHAFMKSTFDICFKDIRPLPV